VETAERIGNERQARFVQMQEEMASMMSQRTHAEADKAHAHAKLAANERGMQVSSTNHAMGSPPRSTKPSTESTVKSGGGVDKGT
jgi:hypothetical protein